MLWSHDITVSYDGHGGADQHGESGEDIMKRLDSVIRMFIRAQGTGVRWLREELRARRVSIPLTDACLGELVREADALVRRAGAGSDRSYVERLRGQLAAEADFVERWTGSDEELSRAGEETTQDLVRIARKHALPRRWKLSDPVVVEYRRTRPSYRQWTDDIDPQALPQA
jgi:hypothetical protein